MYAVVYQVDMNENWEGDPVEAMDQLAAFAKAMPGFIREHGRSRTPAFAV